ncbi:phytanoyl-CoA dioxygenase family protein [Microlunatus sp. Y2014]|uniref:phytanoyl-CoA dioxygenase family protein n=1 Tax=Microlunatus sp. Y2014 TaxID=3418488 RepID=UPI003DA7823E
MDTSIEAPPQRALRDDATWPSEMHNYLFDLNGFVILRGALDTDEVARLNAAFDAFPTDLAPWDWWGQVQRSDSEGDNHKGFELQNIVEAGPAFEALIDHPSWINYMRTWTGEVDSYVEGLFIDECFASVRRSGGYFDIHSGGHHGAVRGQYRYLNGVFRCGQVNALMALTDIGPGDGGTMVIPGSHKSNFPHPGKPTGRGRMDDVEGAIEVHLSAGDVLLFCDGIAHGGSSRTTTEGERRVVIYRYGPSWAATRHGYTYSDALLERLTPSQREILQPVAPRRPPAAD